MPKRGVLPGQSQPSNRRPRSCGILPQALYPQARSMIESRRSKVESQRLGRASHNTSDLRPSTFDFRPSTPFRPFKIPSGPVDSPPPSLPLLSPRAYRSLWSSHPNAPAASESACLGVAQRRRVRRSVPPSRRCVAKRIGSHLLVFHHRLYRPFHGCDKPPDSNTPEHGARGKCHAGGETPPRRSEGRTQTKGPCAETGNMMSCLQMRFNESASKNIFQ